MTVARPRTAPALGRAAYQELRSFRSWHSPRAPAQPWGWWSAPGHPQPRTGYQAASSWLALPAPEMTGTIVRCSLADSSSVSASSPLQPSVLGHPAPSGACGIGLPEDSMSVRAAPRGGHPRPVELNRLMEKSERWPVLSGDRRNGLVGQAFSREE